MYWHPLFLLCSCSTQGLTSHLFLISFHLSVVIITLPMFPFLRTMQSGQMCHGLVTFTGRHVVSWRSHCPASRASPRKSPVRISTSSKVTQTQCYYSQQESLYLGLKFLLNVKTRMFDLVTNINSTIKFSYSNYSATAFLLQPAVHFYCIYKHCWAYTWKKRFFKISVKWKSFLL